MNTSIKGMGIYLPEDVFTSEEVEKKANYEKYGIRSGIVKMVTGVDTRHYTKEDEWSSDVAMKAAVEAIKNAKIDRADIDALLFCSVTQDFAEPATANVVADKLGLSNLFAFDVKNGCNAFLTGLDIADSLIKTGKAKNVLICSGEAISKWVKFDYESQKEIMEGSPVTLSLGDGGGAFVVGAEEEKDKGVLASFFQTFPELWNNNVMWGGGVAYPREPEKMYIPGTTKPLIDKQIMIARDFLEKILVEVGWTIDDIDYIVPSQVAKWVVSSIQSELKIPTEKISDVLHKWGNVASSNVPLAAYDAWKKGKIKEGSKVIFMGGAVGFNASVMAIQF